MRLAAAVVALVIPALAAPALADQCAWVSRPVAAKAAEILAPGKRVIAYCELCKGKHRGTRKPKLILTTAVRVIKSKHSNDVFHEVVLNGRPVDLAYLFVEPSRDGDGAFDNVAKLAGCPTHGVSASLQPEK